MKFLSLLLLASLWCASSYAQKDTLTNSPVPPTEVQIPKEVFLYVEQMPEFPGGKEAMMKYLAQNIVYPATAVEDTVEGKVIVGFVVSTEGEITEVEVNKGVRSDLDAEAVRVVKAMPRWKSGKQNGKPVNVRFTLPIKFTLK